MHSVLLRTRRLQTPAEQFCIHAPAFQYETVRRYSRSSVTEHFETETESAPLF